MSMPLILPLTISMEQKVSLSDFNRQKNVMVVFNRGFT